MRNFIVPVLILFCLILGFGYLLTNTPFLLNVMVPDIVNRHAEGVRIEFFHCRSQKSQLPDILIMRDIQMTMRQGDRTFDVTAEVLTVHNFFDFVRKQDLIYVSGDGVMIKTDHVSAEGSKFKIVAGLQEWKMTFFEGAVFSRELNAGPYLFNRISANVKGDKKGIEIDDIRGLFYNGEMSGKLTFDFDPAFGYVVWSEFQDIDARSVRSPYPEFFSSIEGRIDGSVRVIGSDQVDVFTVILNAQNGAAISPDVFLKMKGAFNDEEETELRRLSQAGAFLKADRALLHMQNSRAQNILFVFDVHESDNQLVLKGRFPFAWDKGFDVFLFPLVMP